MTVSRETSDAVQTWAAVPIKVEATHQLHCRKGAGGCPYLYTTASGIYRCTLRIGASIVDTLPKDVIGSPMRSNFCIRSVRMAARLARYL